MHYMFHAGSVVPMIGASAVVSACMGGAVRFAFPRDGRFSPVVHDLPAQSLAAAFSNQQVLMFTAIFSAMSIIEDRHEGFLQGVLVSPVSRSSLVMGKVAGGVVMAVVQALMFVGLGWLMGRVGLADDLVFELSIVQLSLLVVFMSIVAFGLTSLGFMLAWKLDSIQGFHAIMNVFLMPMWLLSGAFFPASQSGALSWIMKLNPLSYGVAGKNAPDNNHIGIRKTFIIA